MVIFGMGMTKFVLSKHEKMEQMTNKIPSLSAKERRIIELVADGKTNPEIADLMCLSVPTIKWYRKRIRAKFDVDTTVGLIREAIRIGIIH